ncbi:hypothetical protein [Mesobacillus zeae]|uniref:hypothetical protein n=1 Tax=Mesobacillus zeae TaxID=1917180 RepID=UPI0035E41094
MLKCIPFGKSTYLFHSPKIGGINETRFIADRRGFCFDIWNDCCKACGRFGIPCPCHTCLLGKKHMSQVTPFDFVYALILGGTVEETIFHLDHTIPQMLGLIGVWALLIYSVEKLT